MEKLQKVTLREHTTATDYQKETAAVLPDGDLQFFMHDVGDLPKQFFGDDDYEYWLTIEAEWKDTLLLDLVRDRFPGVKDAKAWLEAKGYPFKIGSWA